MAKVSGRDAFGLAASRCDTRVIAASSAASVAVMSPRMRRTSLPTCVAECVVKFASARRTRICVVIQTPPASKTKSAAMRIAALKLFRGGISSGCMRSFAVSAAQDDTRLRACHLPPLRTEVTAHFSPCFFSVMYSSRASALPPT